MTNRGISLHLGKISERRFDVNKNYRPSDSDSRENGGMAHAGSRIKDLREKKELTQPQLAEKTGMAQSTISEIENGQSKSPSALALLKLAKFFEVETEWLLTGEGPKQAVTTMDPDESELLVLFRDLTPAGRVYMLAKVRDFHLEDRDRPTDRPPSGSPNHVKPDGH